MDSVDTPMPQVVAEVVEVAQISPERIVEHIVLEVSVHTGAQFLCASDQRSNRGSYVVRTPQEHMRVPTVMKEIAAVELFLPQELVQERIVEQIVDIVVPPIGGASASTETAYLKSSREAEGNTPVPTCGELGFPEFFGHRLQKPRRFVRQWRVAGQVGAKPSARDVLWWVGYPSTASRGCA